MAENSDLYREILEKISSGVYFVDRERVITYWNKGAERLSGFSASEVVGRRCAELLNHVDEKGEVLCGARCPLLKVIKDGQPRQAEVYMHHKMGQLVPVLIQGMPMESPDGRITGAVEVFNDISPLRMAQTRIRELSDAASRDELTGTYNRRGLEIIFTARLNEFKALASPFGLIFIDLDKFKDINDRYGHIVGDQVLAGVSALLKQSLRETDAIGRWGGDEFVVLLQGVSESSLRRVSRKIEKMVTSQAYQTDAGLIRLGCSAGGAVPQADDSLEKMVARADRKMYSSKATRRHSSAQADTANP
jgi:diguanylate cyclase (GGDEF)-like protein/PAS domain S-box-containing protein